LETNKEALLEAASCTNADRVLGFVNLAESR